jgi:NAD/NADP transhydrogenase beta subunit
MKLKHLLIINAVVCFVYGITFVLSPATVLSLHGLAQDPSAKLTGQFYGSALIAIGLLTWLARNVTDSEARRAIILALLISDVIGVVIAVLGTVSGPMNAFGWSGAAVYALLALGYGYFQFMKPGAP